MGQGKVRQFDTSWRVVTLRESPLSLRRQQLSLQYIVRLRSNPSSPALSCAINTGFGRLFDARPSVIATPQAAAKSLKTVESMWTILPSSRPHRSPPGYLKHRNISSRSHHWAASQKSHQLCVKPGWTSYYLITMDTRGFTQMARKSGRRLAPLPSQRPKWAVRGYPTTRQSSQQKPVQYFWPWEVHGGDQW